MIRSIDIKQLIFQVLRPNYALTSGSMETVNLVSREYIWEWNRAEGGVTKVVTEGSDEDGTYLYVNAHALIHAGIAATNIAQTATVPDCFGGQIKYKPNTPYVFKARIKQGAETTFRIMYEDGIKEVISAPPAGTEGVYEVVHTTDASRTVQKIYMYVNKGVSMYLYDISLTDGSKVYQPPRLNTLYRFVLSLLFPLSPALESWDRSRRKSYAIAACQYGQAQVLAILNKYYGQYGQISIQVNSADMVYFYTAGEEGAVPVYIYSYNDNLMKDPTLAHFPKYDQWHSNGTRVFEEYEGRECMTVTANKGHGIYWASADFGAKTGVVSGDFLTVSADVFCDTAPTKINLGNENEFVNVPVEQAGRWIRLSYSYKYNDEPICIYYRGDAGKAGFCNVSIEAENKATETANTPTYFYTEGSSFGNSTTVVIPKELADSNDYDDFIADLNAMLLYGIKVELKII